MSLTRSGRPRRRRAQSARGIVAAVGAVSLTLAWTAAPSARQAQQSAAIAPAAGVPFVTHARALARGDYARACAQLSRVILGKVKAHNRKEACKVYIRYLRASTRVLDRGRRRSLASTRVVKVRVKHRRARVTIQGTLYGLQTRATGTAVREDGRWRIAKLPSGAHVGRSLVEQIPSESMIPTLRLRDTILVDQDAYLGSMPAIGDIVVFHPPAGSETGGHCAVRPPEGQACAVADRRDTKAKFIKRIVAGPGDRISIRDGRVTRNGALAAESFTRPCGSGAGCDFPRPFIVAAGRYYVLGDNRGASDDSRFWGPVAATSIIGRVQRVGP